MTVQHSLKIQQCAVELVNTAGGVEIAQHVNNLVIGSGPAILNFQIGGPNAFGWVSLPSLALRLASGGDKGARSTIKGEAIAIPFGNASP